MLAGTLVYRSLRLKPRVRDYYGLRYANGIELVYNDAKGMGKTYLTKDLRQVPGFFEMGPDALAPDLSLETFLTRLDAHRGEIKGVLTRERVVSGIGSAYADEILFEARIYPFRKCKSLSTEERTALYFAMRDVLTDRVAFLIPRMRDRLDLHDRVGLRIHGRAGERCVRCGGRISEIAVARRPTHFCRACQPGLLIGQ